MENKNRRSAFSIWKRLVAMTLAVLLLVSSDGITSLPQVLASAADTEAVTENTGENEGNAAPVAEIQTQAAVPETQGQTSAPETQAQTSAPETQAQTNAPETQAQTSAPETQAQTSAPETQAQTNAPETQAQTSAPETQAQTNAPETQPQTNAPETQPQTDAQQTEPETQAQTNAGDVKEPETDAQTEEMQSESETEKESESETEKPKAANRALGSARASGDVVFEFSSWKTSDRLIAGEKLNYRLNYNVPSGGTYSKPTITVTMPARLTMDSWQGEDVQEIRETVNGDTRTLQITLKQKLGTGTARTIDFQFAVQNFVFANGESFNINSRFTGSFTEVGTTTARPLNKSLSDTVTVTADDGWNVTKKVAKAVENVTENGTDYYDVTYEVNVYNQSNAAQAGSPNSEGLYESDWNRNGRLKMLDNSFSLTDILPTNVPSGGGAVSIRSVSMKSVSNPTPVTLAAGGDYTVNMNGDNAVQSVTIKRIDTLKDSIDSKYQFVGAGTPVRTTYTIVVRYPRKPYITPSDEELKIWNLENTANLKYQLLGQQASEKNAKAQIDIGEKEKAGKGQKIEVEKYISIGGEERLYTSGLSKEYGDVQFGLYKDAACSQIANNITGEKAAGTPKSVGIDGKAVFEDLRPGSYYLKETELINGFTSPVKSGVKVSVDADGNISFEGSAAGLSVSDDRKTIKVTNTASTIAAVEFIKKGFDSEGETNVLSGVEFRIVNTGNTSVYYTAVSDDQGKVRFENVKAGTYKLEEISLPQELGEEYTVSSIKPEFTVEANKIVRPDLKVTGAGEEGVFLNKSAKGKLSILKIEEKKPDVKLEGAKFNLYGPYSGSDHPDGYSEQELVKDGNAAYEMVTDRDGEAVSKPLDAGWYCIKEIKAPKDYVIISGQSEYWVKIESNTVTQPVTISNQKKIEVFIEKSGTVGGSVVSPGLAGAEFDIFDENDVKVGQWVTELDSTGKPTSNPVYLQNGKKYYYVETKAPEGYTKLEGKHEFTVDDNSSGGVFKVQCVNAASWGQIKIVKEDSNDSTNKLAGAMFKIYTDAECNNEVVINGTPVGELVTDEHGTVLSPLLPVAAGGETKYYIKELAAPTGYIVTASIIKGTDADNYAVSSGDGISVKTNTQTEVKVKNDPLVQAVIIKEDSVTGEALAGASFVLYSDSSFNELIQGSEAVTNADGKAVFKELIPGRTYYYKEKTAPQGYVSAEDADIKGSFTVPAIEEAGLDKDADGNLTYEIADHVENDRLGDLKIHKTTDFDVSLGEDLVSLEGVEFNLYKKTSDSSEFQDDSKLSQPIGGTKTSDADGAVVWENLNPGSYWLQEITPEGHKAADPREVAVYPGQNKGAGTYDKDKVPVVEIENEAVQGKIQVEKIETPAPGDGGEPKHIQGVVFNIYKKGDELSGDPIATMITGADGMALSGWLDPGGYVMTESVNESGQAVNEKGEIIFNADGTPYYGNAEPVEFVIDKGKTNKNFTGSDAIKNELMGRFEVRKFASFAVPEDTKTSEYPLSGAVINIYRAGETPDAADDIISANLVNKDPIIMASESYMSQWLPAGKYWVVETEAPDGYKLKDGGDTQNAYLVKVTAGRVPASDSQPSADPADPNEIVEIKNESVKGKLRIRKVDPAGNLITIEDGAGSKTTTPASFIYYKNVTKGEFDAADESVRASITDGSGNEIYLVKAAGASSSSVGTDDSMTQTDTAGPGQAVSNLLEPGDTYYLQETEAPQGFFMDKEWWGPYTVTAGNETVADVVNYRENTLAGNKVDENKNPVSGAYIGLYKEETDASAYVKYLQDNNVETNTEAREAIKKLLDDGAYKTDTTYTELNSLLTYAISVNGAIEFKNIKEGTYYAVEIMPPAGYAFDYSVKKIIVNKDGSIDKDSSDAIEFKDSTYGKLQVAKVTTLNKGNANEETYPVQGVRFFVYEAIEAVGGGAGDKTYELTDSDGSVKIFKKYSETPVASGYTQQDGIYETTLLAPDRYYIIEEAGDDNDYSTDHPKPEFVDLTTSDPEYHVIHVETGKTSSAIDADGNILESHQFYNEAKWGRFIIKKVDSLTQEAIPQSDGKIKFQIEIKKDDKFVPYEAYENNGVFSANKEVNGVSENGVYLSGYLEPGTYRLHEITHEHYTPISSEENGVGYTDSFEIKAGKLTGGLTDTAGKMKFETGVSSSSPYIIENVHKATLNIEKKGVFTNGGEVNPNSAIEPLAGVTFKLYKNDGEFKLNSDDEARGNLVGEKTTNNNGKITDWEIDAGEYWLVEVSVGGNAGKYETPPTESYDKWTSEQIAKWARKFSVAAKGVINYSGDDFIPNFTTYGKFKIRKADANDDTLKEPLKDTWFDIYSDEKCTKKVNSSLATGPAAMATSVLLPAGNYWVKESKAPNGYEKSTKVYGPYTVEPNKLNEYTEESDKATWVENSKLFSIEITKTGVTSNESQKQSVNLKGVQFALYGSEEDAKADKANDLTQSGKIGCTDNALKKTNGSKQIGTTGSDGKLVFGGLTVPAGDSSQTKDYWVREIPNAKETIGDTVIPYQEIDGVKYSMSSDDILKVTVKYDKNQTVTKVSIENYKWGSFTINKMVKWATAENGSSGSTQKDQPLDKVRFAVYKVSGNNVAPSAGQKPYREITTSIDIDAGTALAKSGQLPPGVYAVVETGIEVAGGLVPIEEYGYKAQTRWITVEDAKENTEFTGSGSIYNEPTKGRFLIKKFDGDGQTGLSGAKFELYQKQGNNWVLVQSRPQTESSVANKQIVMEAEIYESGMLPAGDDILYRLVEIEAPKKDQIEFQKLADPIEFKITKGTTVELTVKNNPKGSVRFTKKGAQYDSSKAQTGVTVLDGSTFALFTKSGNVYVEIQGTRTSTSKNGVYQWNNLDPGDYYIHEVKAADNYAVNPNYFYVNVPEGKSVNDVLVYEPKKSDEHNKNIMSEDGVIMDEADKGRILIQKTDDSPQVSGLLGAVFAVYAKDTAGSFTQKVCEVTTGADGTVKTPLLDASKDGTEYLVKEIKAPAGFTLDATYYPTEQKVKVYPLFNPGLDAAVKTNTVSFKNKRIEANMAGFMDEIKKSIHDADQTSDDINNPIDAPESLIEEEYKTTFSLSGYADGKNVLGAQKFSVTDNNVILQYLKETTSANTEYVNMDVKNRQDYHYTSVTIYPAENNNKNSGNKTVTATLEYQLYGESGWKQYNNGKAYDLTAARTLPLEGVINGTVTGIRVNYLNVQAGFKLSDINKGIDIDVTFDRREELASDSMHEVRRIINQAQLDWTEKVLGEDGKPVTNAAGHTASVKSNQVAAILPDRSDIMPTVSLTNQITNGAGTNNQFSAGSTVSYRVTAENVSTIPNAVFREPVLTFDLAPYTTLNENFGRLGNGFRVMKRVSSGGSVSYTEFAPGDYSIAADEGVAAETGTKLDTQVNANSRIALADNSSAVTATTTRYVFTFGSHVTLAPGESIVIELESIINFDKPEGAIQFTSPAYLGSNYKIPASAENKNGRSFLALGNDIRTNESVDNSVDGGASKRDYLYQPVEVYTVDSSGLQIVKAISTDGNNWSMTKTMTVNPTDEIYYKLTLYNFSATPAKTARIVDVLPFNGDSYMFNGVNRGTNIPQGADFEEMLFEEMNVSYGGAIEKIVYYYFVEDSSSANSWASRQGNLKDELPFFYGINSVDGGANYKPWGGRWTTQRPSDLSKVTAIGAEVTFADDSLLERSKALEMTIRMKTPGYTADEIEDYADKQMVNAAVASVVRKSDNSIADTITDSDRVESNQVIAKLRLPTGSIGDYAWFDNNNDGKQDATDTPAGNLKVDLYQTVTNVKTGRAIETLLKTTNTDGKGYYEFTDLPCNYLKKDTNGDLTDPENYVGGEFYSYRVVFEMPEGYTATTRYAGDDRTVDSNIDASGSTESVSLSVSLLDGRPVGENNNTLDAGFVRPYKLGDRVWEDINRNGIQDTYIDVDGVEKEEPGVKGAGVFLYKVDGPDGSIDGLEPYARTVTDANGNYWFDKLPEGYYVVVFDISTLVKEDGYTYRYMFTKENVPTDRDAYDSDAKLSKELSSDDRIRKTDVIHLWYGTPESELPDPFVDDRWDAGVTVYSAIGGFCFDDENYTDIQDIYKPLPGTEVELYRVYNGVREDSPIKKTTVGADGKYYFDYLIEGDYRIYFKYPEGYTGVETDAKRPDGVQDDTRDSDAWFDGTDRTQGFTEIIHLKRDSVDTTWDAGACKYSTIGDFVWFDINKNGLQDLGEPGVPGIHVILECRMNGGEWTYYDDTDTDADGKYLFTNVKSSERYGAQYRVAFVFEDNMKITIPRQGDNPEVDSDAILRVQAKGYYVTSPIPVIPYGETDLTWDAGIIVTKGTIGDFVWYDKNRDGIQDEGEVGVPGIPVVLEHNPSGDISNEEAWYVYGETVTNENGYYRFYDLDSGYYRVRFQIPEEYSVTLYNQGSGAMAQEFDSDASREATERWFYSRTFYLDVDVKPEDLSWDAGIYLKTDLVTDPIRVINRVKGPTRVVRPTVTRTVRSTTTRRVVTRRAVTRRSVRTGDNTNIWLWVILLAGAAAVTGAVIYRRKKKK